MHNMLEVQRKMEDGEVVILDGGTGTELERRGVPMNDAAWCAAALATHPSTVREVHEDYIRAGAEVIITNSFPAARHVLEPAGMGDRFRELNARSVELACEARKNAAEEPVYVAGSISTFPPRLDQDYDPPAETVRDNYREQARGPGRSRPARHRDDPGHRTRGLRCPGRRRNRLAGLARV